jgi:integrase
LVPTAGTKRPSVGVKWRFTPWISGVNRQSCPSGVWSDLIRALQSTLDNRAYVKPHVERKRRLRDRFLFALLASTGMRIGQALALRHEDLVSWERRIRICDLHPSDCR